MQNVGAAEVISHIKQKLIEWGIINPPHPVGMTLEGLAESIDDLDYDILLDEDIESLLDDDDILLFELEIDDELSFDYDIELEDEIFDDLFEDDLMGTDQTLENLVEMGGDEPATQPQSKVDFIRQLSGEQAFKIEHMDITTIETGAIAHGVNCQLAMGSGVAAVLFRKWPLVRSQYMLRGQGKGMLGHADAVEVDRENDITVYNCYTQLFCGPGDKRYANSASIMMSLFAVADDCDIENRPMYVPLIGCDLGGLDYKNDFLPVLEQLMVMYPSLDLTLCVYP